MIAGGMLLFLWGGLSFEIKHSAFWKIVCLPGELSYGIYLLHSMVLYLVWNYLNLTNPWASFCLYLAANTALAQLSGLFFERPANYWTRRQVLRLFSFILD
jgi:peptidoglycan/LPS O-acetylase OafA/YrhL